MLERKSCGCSRGPRIGDPGIDRPALRACGRTIVKKAADFRSERIDLPPVCKEIKRLFVGVDCRSAIKNADQCYRLNLNLNLNLSDRFLDFFDLSDFIDFGDFLDFSDLADLSDFPVYCQPDRSTIFESRAVKPPPISSATAASAAVRTPNISALLTCDAELQGLNASSAKTGTDIKTNPENGRQTKRFIDIGSFPLVDEFIMSNLVGLRCDAQPITDFTAGGYSVKIGDY